MPCLFFFAVIGATYTANLASLLVGGQQQPLIIADIDEAIARGMTFCTQDKANPDIFISKKYPTAQRIPLANEKEMYEALNDGRCDIVIGVKQTWFGYQQQTDFNPNCDLRWVGRDVAPFSSSFTTKVDPGVRCTGLVNEVFNYYLSELKDEDFINQQWQAYDETEATNDCGGADTKGRRRRLVTSKTTTSSASTTMTERVLKGGSSGAAAGGAVATSTNNAEEESSGEDSSMTLFQMAGTFALHLLGTMIAILVGLASAYEKRTNVKRHGSKLNNNSSGSSADATSHVDFPCDEEGVSVQAQLHALRVSQAELAAQMNLIVNALGKLQHKLDHDDNASFLSARDEVGSLVVATKSNRNLWKKVLFGG